MDNANEQAIEAYDQRLKNVKSNAAKKFKSQQEMKAVLQDDVRTWQVDHQTEKQAELGTLPRLPTLNGAKIMFRHFYFCLFSNDESERMAVYLPDQGIYTQNYRYLKRLIAMMYAPYNDRQAEDVIYHLEMMAPTRQLTYDRYLIPVSNGIWNLHRHELMPFSHEHVFTTKIATKYREKPLLPNIDGWTFDSWLAELACNDKEIVKLFWQVINDSLNGNYTRKKAIFLFSEKGNSGKGTFQQLITNLVGQSNVGTLKVNEFDARFRLAGLVGKTVCIGDDIAPDIYIKDSSNFNSVVTGDLVNIEAKGQDGYTAKLTPTIIQSCNGMPHFHNKGGTMRRLVIVPFNNHFQGTGDNWKVRSDYIANKDVLEYVLNQALQLDFEKFDIPKQSQQALEEFEIDNDSLLGFKTNFFSPLNISKVPTKFLYAYYQKYCKENGLRAYGQGRFVHKLVNLLPEYEYKKAKLSETDIQDLNAFKEQDEINVYPPIPIRGTPYNCVVRN